VSAMKSASWIFSVIGSEKKMKMKSKAIFVAPGGEKQN
jgi:hypothetical protein